MSRRRTLIGSAAAIAAVLTVLGQQASTAKPTPDPDPPATDGVYSAMQRDLGLSAREAKDRVSDEAKAAKAERKLRKELGSDFGGAWYDADSSRLVVGVVDDADAATVREAGAGVRQVEFTEDRLDAFKAKLDAKKSKAPQSVPGWYVDVVANTIVVQSRSDAVASAEEFAKRAGVPADAVTVKSTTESPRTFIDVIGGNAYFIGGSRCSVGFSVNGGFVTAGHCGTTGARPRRSRAARSEARASPATTTPTSGRDAGNTPLGVVNNYAGGTVAVAGSQDAAVSSPSAGRLDDRLALRHHPGPQLDRDLPTGDRHGAHPHQRVRRAGRLRWIGHLGQPGPRGDLRWVGQLLQRRHHVLPAGERDPAGVRAQPVTSSGGGGGGTCTGPSYSGSLGSGGSAVQPNGSYYFSSGSGTHRGCLDGPSGSDFDLYLQKWSGSTWASVAQGITASADETVSYSGTAGYYRWVVDAYSGSGSYTLGTNRP